MKQIISTTDAPEAVGPYSQATTNGELVFTAGQLPMTPDGEMLDDEAISTQTAQSLSNIESVLSDQGIDMSDVLKMTVFLDNIENFEEMNEAYNTFFDDQPPARSAIEVAALPNGAGVEIEAIATSD